MTTVNNLKFSEQLILRAEWWFVDYDPDLGAQTMGVAYYIKQIYGDALGERIIYGSVEESWLCLLEAEIVKDEEAECELPQQEQN